MEQFNVKAKQFHEDSYELHRELAAWQPLSLPSQYNDKVRVVNKSETNWMILTGKAQGRGELVVAKEIGPKQLPKLGAGQILKCSWEGLSRFC